MDHFKLMRCVYSEKNSFCVSKLLSWSALSVETRQYAAMFIVNLSIKIKSFCYIFYLYINAE